MYIVYTSASIYHSFPDGSPCYDTGCLKIDFIDRTYYQYLDLLCIRMPHLECLVVVVINKVSLLRTNSIFCRQTINNQCVMENALLQTPPLRYPVPFYTILIETKTFNDNPIKIKKMSQHKSILQYVINN